MREKLCQFIRSFIKNQQGFSLIEAILTVAIVGIAVIPISVVFTQTMGTTVRTRKQLDANELAQEYVEEVRGKSFDDFYDMFPIPSSTSIELDSTMTAEFVNAGLNKIPDGYKLKVSYDTTTDLPAYEAPILNPIGAIDGVISIPSDRMDPSTRDFTIYQSDGTTYIADSSGVLSAATTSVNRTIYVKLDRGSNSYHVYYKYTDGLNGIVLEEISTPGLVYGANPSIKILVGNDGIVGPNQGYETTLQIDSNLIEEVKVYVFESSLSPIDLQTETLSGYVSYSRNLSNGSSNNRIVDVTVSIIDESNGESLIELVTTKVEE